MGGTTSSATAAAKPAASLVTFEEPKRHFTRLQRARNETRVREVSVNIKKDKLRAAKRDLNKLKIYAMKFYPSSNVVGCYLEIDAEQASERFFTRWQEYTWIDTTEGPGPLITVGHTKANRDKLVGQ